MDTEEQENKVLRDRQPHDMLKLLGFFDGSMATVFVGSEQDPRKYNLPKDLLCDQSTYFFKALNGDFKEGKEQIVRLTDQDPKMFDLVIQWIVSGSVVILPTQDNKETDQALITKDMIHQHLKFLKLVDFLQLTTSPGRFICDKVLAMFLAHPRALEAEHLMAAVELPANHAIRVLFAQILAEDYLRYTFDPDLSFANWKLYQKVKDFDDINLDILKAVGQILQTVTFSRNKGGLHELKFTKSTSPTKKFSIYI